MANGTSTDAGMRCPLTRKLKQRRFPQEKQNCIKKTTSEKESLTRSRTINDREPRCVMRDSISEVGNAVNDVTSLLEENGKVSDKTIHMDTRTTTSSKESNGNRLSPLALEKAEYQKSNESQDQRSKPGSLQIEKLGKRSELVETRSNGSSVISKTPSARRVLYLKVKALKGQEELQTRIEKLKREAKEIEKAAFQEALARKARIAEIERQIAKVSNSCESSLRSISPVGSPGDNLTKDSGSIDKRKTAENGAKSNIVVSVHSKSDNAMKLVHKGKFSAHMKDSKPLA